MPHRFEDAVVEQTVKQMSKNGLAILAGNIAAVIFIALYYWWIADMTFFIGWGIGIFGILAVRAILIVYCTRANSTKLSFRQKYSLLTLGILCTGVAWSVMVQFVILNLNFAQMVIMYIAVAGLVSASLATSAGTTRGFSFFAIPILLPMATLHIASGNTEQILLGGFILIFGTTMLFAATHISGFVRESIAYNFENKALLDNLIKEKEHILMLNERLNHDLKKRVGVMEWLASGRSEQGNMTEEMHVLSSKDALTGLANRRRFYELLNTEWARSRRDESPVALIKCDIDHFKSFNDSLGAQEGDLCLSTVASCLSRFARRTTDLVARYGEDEFVILLPSTTETDALLIAEEIRTAILRQNIPHPSPQESAQITLTLGVSALTPRRNNTEMTLIKQADIALYRAKQLGRNRVNSFSSSAQSRKVTIRDLIRPQSQDS